MDAATFLVRFPEFEKAPASLLEAKLGEAARRIDPVVWGDKTDDGIGYLAAHLTALSPFGQQARLVARDGGTVYWETYEQIKREVAAGPRVI